MVAKTEIEPALENRMAKIVAEWGPGALERLLDAFDQAAIEPGPGKRLEIKERWEIDRVPDPSEESALMALRKALEVPRPVEITKPLTQAEVDALARSIKPIRVVQKMIEGVHAGIRRVIFMHMDRVSGEGEPGYVESPAEGYEFKRTVAESKSTPNGLYRALAEVLPEAAWRALGRKTVSYEFDDERFGKALKAGKIKFRGQEVPFGVKELEAAREHLPKPSKTARFLPAEMKS
jgi:hypothetical protein